MHQEGMFSGKGGAARKKHTRQTKDFDTWGGGAGRGGRGVEDFFQSRPLTPSWVAAVSRFRLVTAVELCPHSLFSIFLRSATDKIKGGTLDSETSLHSRTAHGNISLYRRSLACRRH